MLAYRSTITAASVTVRPVARNVSRASYVRVRSKTFLAYIDLSGFVYIHLRLTLLCCAALNYVIPPLTCLSFELSLHASGSVYFAYFITCRCLLVSELG